MYALRIRNCVSVYSIPTALWTSARYSVNQIQSIRTLLKVIILHSFGHIYRKGSSSIPWLNFTKALSAVSDAEGTQCFENAIIRLIAPAYDVVVHWALYWKYFQEDPRHCNWIQFLN